MSPLLQTQAVHFAYRDRQVLTDISIAIPGGRVIALLGPNGGGKTTLLKILLGILPPRSGAVLLENRPLAAIPRRELARRIAYVPQSHREAFAYTVRDVVLMGRAPHQGFFAGFSARDRDIAAAAMDRIGISPLQDRPYTEISGGERQLALIARALTQGADTLIMDEPANGLDFGNQIRLLEQTADLARDGYTFIMSTHFPDHALWVADHVFLLQNGRLLAEGSPDAVMNEANLHRLYGAEVRMFTANGRAIACLPRSVLRGRRNGKMVPPPADAHSAFTLP